MIKRLCQNIFIGRQELFFLSRLCNVKSIALRYNALDNESTRPLARNHVS